MMGKRCDLDLMALASLAMSAALMNVGYLLLSPKDDTKRREWGIEGEEFHEHPELSRYLLKETQWFAAEVAEAVLQHHERWDGSGYPNGLKGKDISFFARILAITDTYYELVSFRPNARTYMPHKAVEHIMASGNELFDPDLVQTFAREVPLYPAGVSVRLNTGESGVIADPNLGHVGRPVVRICYGGNLTHLSWPFDIDLSQPKNQNILVVDVIDF